VSKMDAPCFSPLSLARETIIEAMQKLKGKTGQQTVEHVHVYQGGQAIVGAVSQAKTEPGEGGQVNETAQTPHNKRRAVLRNANPPQRLLDGCPLRRENEAWNAVPVPRDDKRSLQAPRGTEHGAEDGSRHRAHSASAAETWKVHEGG
jgi:hypothetical protein